MNYLAYLATGLLAAAPMGAIGAPDDPAPPADEAPVAEAAGPEQKADDAAASADRAAAQKAAADDKPQSQKERVICTREAAVGTRLPNRRVCRTEREWAVIRGTSEETAAEIQRMPIPQSGGG